MAAVATTSDAARARAKAHWRNALQIAKEAKRRQCELDEREKRERQKRALASSVRKRA